MGISVVRGDKMKTFVGIMVEIGCLFAMTSVTLCLGVVAYVVSTLPHNEVNWLNAWLFVIGDLGLFFLIYWIRYKYGYFSKYEKVELWIKNE
jgi:hypothetical protein